MANQPVHRSHPVVVDDVIARYYDRLQSAAERIRSARGGSRDTFAPEFRLPSLDNRMAAFFDASLGFFEVGLPDTGPAHVLDLMRNPGSRTTKTLASLVIVARAIDHIRSTGESLLLVTPTSGNKGSALRDAVGRAIRHGLVEPHQLRIVTVVPRQSSWKVRSGFLSDDRSLSELNPVIAADVSEAADVKAVAADFVRLYADQAAARTGARLWYSLDLDNYRLADTVRAFAEAEFLPFTERPRIHAHAVSSGYGLLGYSLGHSVLNAGTPHPGFLLVQGLSTPDMVLNLLTGSFSRDGLPRYRSDAHTGMLHQDSSPHFPAHCQDVGEELDPTFYTHEPVTSPLVNALIREHGGSGIVVSHAECAEAYPHIRRELLTTGLDLPEDSGELREWSLVKVLTGTALAVRRSILAQDTEIVVHGTGAYWDTVLPSLPAGTELPVNGPADILDVLVPGPRSMQTARNGL